VQNLDYIAAMLLFVIGLATMLFHSNLIKKIMGMNIMETAIFLLFIASGYVTDAKPPIALAPGEAAVNPLPQALILTGLVVSVSITAYALALVRDLYRHFGTLNATTIARRKGSFT
jgi:multicomponent Na+:H+ antiporter subunit C